LNPRGPQEIGPGSSAYHIRLMGAVTGHIAAQSKANYREDMCHSGFADYSTAGLSVPEMGMRRAKPLYTGFASQVMMVFSTSSPMACSLPTGSTQIPKDKPASLAFLNVSSLFSTGIRLLTAFFKTNGMVNARKSAIFRSPGLFPVEITAIGNQNCLGT
jgi:hypothetical protein